MADRLRRLSDLRPRDKCGKPIAPLFYVIDVSQAMLNPGAVNETLGLMQMMGGALPVAEAMGARADEVVTIFGDQEPSLRTTLIVCHGCVLIGPLDLAQLIELVHHRPPAREPGT